MGDIEEVEPYGMDTQPSYAHVASFLSKHSESDIPEPQDVPQREPSRTTSKSPVEPVLSPSTPIAQWPVSQRWVILPPDFHAGMSSGISPGGLTLKSPGLKRIPSEGSIRNGFGTLTPIQHQFHKTRYGFKTSDELGAGIHTFDTLERLLTSPSEPSTPRLGEDRYEVETKLHHLDDIANALGLTSYDADVIIMVLRRLAMESGVGLGSLRYKKIERDFAEKGFEV